ncbi:MAG: TetR family transcriptional regulator C-terminal domain-containing protein [Clostridiales bacterium]|nr:TetR family transcriptional regulator C-terminal domain-containing protein [Clostridiales bacterium]
MNKNDRRVKKTQAALQHAFAELMLEKDLNHITVQELTNRANIHRVTFYTHYHDVYDLYTQIEENTLAELGNIAKNDPAHLYEGIYDGIIDYIYDNQTLFHMFLCSGNTSFTDHLSELFEMKYLSIWLFEDNLTEITAEMRYLTAYHIHGCLAIITTWAKSNFAMPKKEIIHLLLNADTNFEQMLM